MAAHEMAAECIRCGAPILSRPAAGAQTTAALTIAALVLYIPANVYPILKMNLYGASSENTIWDVSGLNVKAAS